MNEPDPDRFRQILNTRRALLRADSESGAEAAETVELDQARVGRLSRMDALATQAMAQESQRRRAAELVRIEAAFRRLDADEFGSCIDCGEEIAEQRLILDPSSTLCIACASRRESPNR
jgi:DnaK suppressor protein